MKRLTLLLLLLGTLIGGSIAWIGSEILVSPERRSLERYHQTILARPAEYGLREPVSFTGPRAAPCQIYLPTAQPGRARKSRALRRELSRRGVEVPAWGETVGTLVLLHGRLGRKEDHLPIAQRFCAAGFACIVWDLPGHGDNPCPHATFGATECREIHEVVQAAQKAFALPPAVGLFGISQGGAIALQAMVDSDDYFAVASIAAFAELGSLIEEGATHLKFISRPLAAPATGLVRVGTFLRAGFDPGQICPSCAARSITKPVFIAHGALDQYVRPSHAHAIYEAIPHQNKTLCLVPDGSHGDVLSKGGNAIYADLAEFFLATLPRR